jgi:hypothetical protein
MSCTVIDMNTYRQLPTAAGVVQPDDELTAYCKKLGLSYVQTESCREVANLVSLAEGKHTADRIHDKMRTIRARYGTRDDGPSAA